MPVNHFAISAHSGPLGENPFGEAHFVATTTAPNVYRFDGRIVCLNVQGNRATAVFAIDHESSNEPPVVAGDVMYLQDNGEPQGGVSPDMMQNSELTANQLQAFELFGCPPPITPVVPLTSGNIVVHDAQP